MPDPDEFEFFGMTYKCDIEHFKMTVQEEIEVIYSPFYFISWGLI